MTAETPNAKGTMTSQGASPRQQLPLWAHYAIAIAITIVVTLVRLAYDPVLSTHSVFHFYYASVVMAAWYCGLGPSILNVALGAAIASYTFAEPRGSFRIYGLGHQLA